MNEKQYTPEQISEAVQYWKSKTPAIMPDEEAGQQQIDEVNAIGKAVSKVKNAVKDAAGAVGGAVSKLASDAHDALFKNPGVKQFAKIMQDNADAKKDRYEESDMYLCVKVDGKFYNVIDVEFLDKNFLKLGAETVCLIANMNVSANKHARQTFTVEDFAEKLAAAGIKRSKLTSVFSAFVLGEASRSSLSESEAADSPFDTPEDTPKGNVVYLGNPFKQVTAKNGWIVFEFDLTKEEKHRKDDDMWG